MKERRRRKKISQSHGRKSLCSRNFQFICHHSADVGHLIFSVLICCLFVSLRTCRRQLDKLKMTAHRVKCTKIRNAQTFSFLLYNSWQPYKEMGRKSHRLLVGVYSKNPADEQIRINSNENTTFFVPFGSIPCVFLGSRAYGLLDVLSNWNDQIFVSSFALHPTSHALQTQTSSPSVNKRGIMAYKSMQWLCGNTVRLRDWAGVTRHQSLGNRQWLS